MHENFLVGRAFSLLLETTFATAFLAASIVTANLFLLAIAVGMAVGPMTTAFGWTNPGVRIVRHVPFALLLVQLVLLSLPAAGWSGLTSQLVLIHF
jgi:hypothetical protein